MLDDMLDAETAELNPMDRDGNPIKGSDGKPWLITLAGPSHPIAFQLDDLRQRRVVQRLAKQHEADVDPVEQALQPIIARTIAWTPIELEGKDLPCNSVNARLLYSQSVLLRNQVERFCVRASNFTRRPSVN